MVWVVVDVDEGGSSQTAFLFLHVRGSSTLHLAGVWRLEISYLVHFIKLHNMTSIHVVSFSNAMPKRAQD